MDHSHHREEENMESQKMNGIDPSHEPNVSGTAAAAVTATGVGQDVRDTPTPTTITEQTQVMSESVSSSTENQGLGTAIPTHTEAMADVLLSAPSMIHGGENNHETMSHPHSTPPNTGRTNGEYEHDSAMKRTREDDEDDIPQATGLDQKDVKKFVEDDTNIPHGSSSKRIKVDSEQQVVDPVGTTISEPSESVPKDTLEQLKPTETTVVPSTGSSTNVGTTEKVSTPKMETVDVGKKFSEVDQNEEVEDGTSEHVMTGTKDVHPTVDKTAGEHPVMNGGKSVQGTDSSVDLPQPMPVTTADIVRQYTSLPKLQSTVSGLEPLTDRETKELEKVFDFRKNGLEWNEDWLGDLALLETEISDPDGKSGVKTKKALWLWAETSQKKKSLRLLNNVLRYVYHHPMKRIPEQAKNILASADPTSVASLQEAVKRVSYDPDVLKQDGWTTTKAARPETTSGGSHRLGEKVLWQNWIGVIIAYVHDDDMGDLWKAMWIEDFTTFDLELEELQDARKKYLRRISKEQGEKKEKAESRSRTVSSTEFQVDGIEHGIVMAMSYAKGARHGVFWPARVLHASEVGGAQGRRGTSRTTKVDVVFIAPYWNSDPSMIGGSNAKRIDSFSDSVARHGEAVFNSGPLFEVESIDASNETMVSYPYDPSSGLDMDVLLTSFKFTGLPKAAFLRFVDSHRLALGFLAYSQDELRSEGASDVDRATASLIQAHPLSVQTAHFPPSVLHLPFDFILLQLPEPGKKSKGFLANDDSGIEPPLLFGRMLDAMAVPRCWGIQNEEERLQETSNIDVGSFPGHSELSNGAVADNAINVVKTYLHGLTSLQAYIAQSSPFARMLKTTLMEIAQVMAESIDEEQDAEAKITLLKTKYRAWVVAKTNGEEYICSEIDGPSINCRKEWRRCCERIYKTIQSNGLGDGERKKASTTWVLTDSGCNLHVTSSKCFERPVRLPAAISAARQATGNVRLQMTVDERYIEMAEKQIILRAHKKSYIDRIKKRCALASDDETVALTEDSDGNGGEDTVGSRGTWTAALAAVGAALQGTDMIMNGHCVNAFCATRPPGHHAGRDLHSMKAVSNGFCILNAVACAALYATMPLSQGGLGLSRVCVIDIDVHHGNGTQDILCSTYDPRFLYVSIHAGGPMINGVDFGDDAKEIPHHLRGNAKKGIFPGRSGDTSPHDGVLNIPLGGRVSAHALGTALMTRVSPRVDRFSPELILISAGFDAHKNDPLNMGGLSATDFGTLTEVICKLAQKSCSGRVLSVLEGGYGVPCCQPQTFTPEPEAKVEQTSTVDGSTTKPVESEQENAKMDANASSVGSRSSSPKGQEPMYCLDLGSDMPPNMKDEVASYALQQKLNRCHAEGFIHAVREHVSGLARCNTI